MDLESLQSLIRQNGSYVLSNAEGVSQAESLRESPGRANSFNWIVGHVAYWRNVMLQMAGAEPVWTDVDGALYRGSPGEPERRKALDPADAFDIERLVADFELMQRRFEERVASSTVDTVGPSKILNLMLHESYHAGQLGIVRRALGKPGVF